MKSSRVEDAAVVAGGAAFFGTILIAILARVTLTGVICWAIYKAVNFYFTCSC